jgi:hypothetical protein
MAPNGFVSRFRIIHLFNGWALTIVGGFVLCLLYAATEGSISGVPSWAWVFVIGNGVAFALYFLLSGPVAEWLERTGRTPAALERFGERLAAWDEAGRE